MIKVNPFVVPTRRTFDPDGNSLGYLNIYEFNDLRIQIAKERAEGYYAMFEDKIIMIKSNGSCDCWPNGFFDQYEAQLRELIHYKFINTSEKWQELYPNPRVLDPDGWDRQNYQFSWHEEKISYKEYQRRLSLSTCLNYKENP
jgi:hypothetical protein